jgi:hypothetical protein
MRDTVLLLAAFALVHPGLAGAQGNPNRCGDRTGAQDRLEDLSHYFTDVEDAEFRQGMIQPVRAGAVQAVVQDSRVCNAVYHKMVAQLRTNTNWRDLQRTGFRHVILQYGPYYAVLVNQVTPPGKLVFGWTEMMVFRASDLALLGVRAV